MKQQEEKLFVCPKASGECNLKPKCDGFHLKPHPFRKAGMISSCVNSKNCPACIPVEPEKKGKIRFAGVHCKSDCPYVDYSHKCKKYNKDLETDKRIYFFIRCDECMKEPEPKKEPTCPKCGARLMTENTVCSNCAEGEREPKPEEEQEKDSDFLLGLQKMEDLLEQMLCLQKCKYTKNETDICPQEAKCYEFEVILCELKKGEQNTTKQPEQEKCTECKGKGKIFSKNVIMYEPLEICPTCKGTGLKSKVEGVEEIRKIINELLDAHSFQNVQLSATCITAKEYFDLMEKEINKRITELRQSIARGVEKIIDELKSELVGKHDYWGELDKLKQKLSTLKK